MTRRERLVLEVDDRWTPAVLSSQRAMESVSRAFQRLEMIVNNADISGTMLKWADASIQKSKQFTGVAGSGFKHLGMEMEAAFRGGNKALDLSTTLLGKILRGFGTVTKYASKLSAITFVIFAGIKGAQGFVEGLVGGLSHIARLFGPVGRGLAFIVRMAPAAAVGLYQLFELRGTIAKSVIDSPIGRFFKGLAQSILDMTTSLENFRNKYLTIFAGNAPAADRMMKQIETFTARTPYQIPQTTAAVSTLGAFDVRKDRMLDYLKAVGNAAAATGNSIEEMAFSFANATAGQMRGLKRIGITAGDIRKELKGTIDVMSSVGRENVAEAIMRIMERRFPDAMERMMGNTITGIFSNLKDTFWQFKKLFSEDFGDAFLGVMQRVDAFVQRVKSSGQFEAVGRVLGESFRYIVDVIDQIRPRLQYLVLLVGNLVQNEKFKKIWEAVAKVLAIIAEEYLQDIEEKILFVANHSRTLLNIINRIPEYWAKFVYYLTEAKDLIIAFGKWLARIDWQKAINYLMTFVRWMLNLKAIGVGIAGVFKLIIGIIASLLVNAIPIIGQIASVVIAFGTALSVLKDFGKAGGMLTVSGALSAAQVKVNDMIDGAKKFSEEFGKGSSVVLKRAQDGQRIFIDTTDERSAAEERLRNQLEANYQAVSRWLGVEKARMDLQKVGQDLQRSYMSGFPEFVQGYKDRITLINRETHALQSEYDAFRRAKDAGVFGGEQAEIDLLRRRSALQQLSVDRSKLDNNFREKALSYTQGMLDLESSLASERVNRARIDGEMEAGHIRAIREQLEFEKRRLAIMEKLYTYQQKDKEEKLKALLAIEQQHTTIKRIQESLKDISKTDWQTDIFGTAKFIQSLIPAQGGPRIGLSPTGGKVITINAAIEDRRDLRKVLEETILPEVEKTVYVNSGVATGPL